MVLENRTKNQTSEGEQLATPGDPRAPKRQPMTIRTNNGTKYHNCRNLKEDGKYWSFEYARTKMKITKKQVKTIEP